VKRIFPQWPWSMVAGAAAAAAVVLLLSACREAEPRDAGAVDRLPRMSPDYSGAVIPPNIAPLNFAALEPGTAFRLDVEGGRAGALRTSARDGRMCIPLREWKELLRANPEGALTFRLHVRRNDGTWQAFAPFSVSIAAEPVDEYVVYRRINVLYDPYVRMRLCQRRLSDFSTTVVLDNEGFGEGCMNCHTFLKNSTDRFIFHMRSGQVNYGVAMVLVEDGRATKIDTRTERTPRPAAFSSWHPSGRLIAFSFNRVRQFFHTARTEIRDGIDLDSDLALYLFDEERVTSSPLIAAPDRLETFPAWSADGRYLYYCSAPRLWDPSGSFPPALWRDCSYDLMRIAYDPGTGEWGEPETVLSAEETGKSITEPRVSPDGRFVAVCTSDYSTFPTFQRSGDIDLLNLGTGELRRLECNSDMSESWHSWSSSGRWLAFTSKRGDGLFARIYLSHIDEEGRAGVPFVIPQEDPAYHTWNIDVCQLPELVTSALPIGGERLARVLRSPDWVKGELPMTGASPLPAGRSGGPGLCE
jgi:hypothetical protein